MTDSTFFFTDGDSALVGEMSAEHHVIIQQLMLFLPSMMQNCDTDRMEGQEGPGEKLGKCKVGQKGWKSLMSIFLFLLSSN